MFRRLFSSYLTRNRNYPIATCSLPGQLTLTEVVLIFKKDDLFDKENYLLICLLSRTCKAFWKKMLFKQINNFIEHYFSDILACFGRNHNIQSLGKWKHLADNGYYIGVHSMDLSKASGVLSYSLLFAE